MSINTIVIDKHGTRKETNQKAHGGLTTMHVDIIVAQYGEIINHIKV
jgi:hypothetical protein